MADKTVAVKLVGVPGLSSVQTGGPGLPGSPPTGLSPGSGVGVGGIGVGVLVGVGTGVLVGSCPWGISQCSSMPSKNQISYHSISYLGNTYLKIFYTKEFPKIKSKQFYQNVKICNTKEQIIEVFSAQ